MNRSINKIKQRTIKDLALFINNNPDKDEKKPYIQCYLVLVLQLHLELEQDNS